MKILTRVCCIIHSSHPGTPLQADGSLSVEPGDLPFDCRHADPAFDALAVVCPILLWRQS